MTHDDAGLDATLAAWLGGAALPGHPFSGEAVGVIRSLVGDP
ncbi:hypothetical protein [Dactylosporangium sp. CA-092794]